MCVFVFEYVTGVVSNEPLVVTYFLMMHALLLPGCTAIQFHWCLLVLPQTIYVRPSSAGIIHSYYFFRGSPLINIYHSTKYVLGRRAFCEISRAC